MENQLAPICLFTYNRINETKQTVEALQNNYLAQKSDLFIISDGYDNLNQLNEVQLVRKYLRTINGFKSIKILESKDHKGLANSIISGVTEILEKYGKVIVLEDDLLTSANFLSYMNETLRYYEPVEKIFSISGFSVEIEKQIANSEDIYFWGRANSWGWATWRNRWRTVDWQCQDYSTFLRSRKLQNNFNKYGSDLSKMLINSKEGKVDSWFIRFAYNQFKQGKYTVYPTTSKVFNNGFSRSATHCNTYNRMKIKFDNSFKTSYHFPKEISINNKIASHVYKPHSVKSRAYGKIMTLLMRMGVIKQRKLV